MIRLMAALALLLSIGMATAAAPLVLAVYDATHEVPAGDLSEDSGLLAILNERPLRRDDVKSAIDQLVYFRKASLDAHGMYSRETYRASTKGRRARLQAIYDVIMEKEIEPSLPEIREASIEAFYVDHATAFAHAPQYRFQHMFRKNVPGEPRAAQSSMEEASRALDAGQAFTEVARTYGEGFDNPGQVVEESGAILAQAAPRLVYQLERLAPGECSGPFPTESGWGLIKLIDKTSGRPMTSAEAHDRVAGILRAQLRLEHMGQLVMELEERYSVQRHYERLDEKMSNGPQLVLFSLGEQDYIWKEIQRMFLFADTETSIRMSRPASAIPLIDNLLNLYLLERLAIEKGYDSDPRLQRAYDKAVDEELNRSMIGIKRTIGMQKEFKPTEAEMRRYYEAHKRDKYWSPPLLDLQLIYLPYLYPPNADAPARERQEAAARSKMDEVESMLAAGEDFGAVARQHSKHPSAAESGRIRGANALRMWGPERRSQFMSNPPKTYPAFEWNQGLAKVRILEASAGYALPFERVRTQIEKMDMYEEAEAVRVEGIKAEYLEKADIQYHWPNIVQFIRNMNKPAPPPLAGGG